MRFSRSFNWILKSFPPEKTGFENPRILADAIGLIADIFGTSRIGELQTETGSGTAGVTFVDGSIPAAGFYRLVLYGHGTHSEGSPKTVFWAVNNPVVAVPNNVQISVTAVSLASSNPLGLPYSPVIIPPGGRISFRSLDTIVGSLTLAYHFLDLPVGEYFRF